MKFSPLFIAFAVGAFATFLSSSLNAQTEEDDFVYNVGEVDYFTGEGANIGGFIFPELFAIGTGGFTEPGSEVSDFASGAHDPFNDLGFQALEVDLFVNINDVVTGLIAGSGFQIEDNVWEAELEEAFLHYHVNDSIAIGGGQFLNAFGFTSTQHVHGWDFVNQNLVNTRMLNEGHLFVQGGEVVFKTPNAGVLTVALGGVRSHSHSHGHGGHGHDDHDDHGHDDHDDHGHDDHDGQGHDDHDEHDHDEHDHDEIGHDDHDEHGHDEHSIGGGHFDYHDAEFNDWIFSADYKFRLPFDDSITVSASIATGENGFGGDQYLYGVGVQKVWNGHDHGSGGPDFCENAFMLRSEFIGRSLEAVHDDGDVDKFNDQGITTLLAYGLNEQTTLSFRHDWVSDLEDLGLADTHRFSPALTTFIDPKQRVRMRLQYDNVQSSEIDSEHIGWIQFQVQWGGEGGSHAGHNH